MVLAFWHHALNKQKEAWSDSCTNGTIDHCRLSCTEDKTFGAMQTSDLAETTVVLSRRMLKQRALSCSVLCQSVMTSNLCTMLQCGFDVRTVWLFFLYTMLMLEEKKHL